MSERLIVVGGDAAGRSAASQARQRRPLGAQIVGGPGAGKRIDVFATTLWNNMRADEIMQLDLAYAPPFATVWDPVLIAARKAWEASRAMP
jgi:hypothetical protein